MRSNTVAVVAVLALVAVVIWFEAQCLRDLAQARDEDLRYLTRWQWAILCVITIPLGGILYLLYGKGPRRYV